MGKVTRNPVERQQVSGKRHEQTVQGIRAEWTRGPGERMLDAGEHGNHRQGALLGEATVYVARNGSASRSDRSGWAVRVGSANREGGCVRYITGVVTPH
ncbi:unnamed protein product [Protopolystoma xenopodis]|uniref:Uncharacterized protein n=1 Tax=Protopolystoma xenopodis TaxID=117903 RepID=A0A448WGI2_9PLAT|nr:unnamed protein product [Protopolystoma xenopodis]